MVPQLNSRHLNLIHEVQEYVIAENEIHGYGAMLVEKWQDNFEFVCVIRHIIQLYFLKDNEIILQMK